MSSGMDTKVAKSKVVPFSLKDAPSLIERVWPAQKISIEAQKERKAVQGQTLVSLASYWKGRKPLSLVRACVLGALLPSTGNDEADLQIFEILMGMSDDQIINRLDANISVADIIRFGSSAQQKALLEFAEEDDGAGAIHKKIPRELRFQQMADVISQMPYQERVSRLRRAEEISEVDLTERFMTLVNGHLNTSAGSLPELIQQLGVARFGHRPVIADTFSGGGSIPFEASRLGCDVFASDLNPIACMLTWGAIEFLGSNAEFMNRFENERRRVIDGLDRRLLTEEVEVNKEGDRARIYLYCVEAFHKPTGWHIPLSPSWVLHEGSKSILELIPNPKKKRFDFEVITGASKQQYAKAAKGTVSGGNVVFFDGSEEIRISIADLRGDKVRQRGKNSENNLRQWEKSDVAPSEDDIFGERLCAIKWTKKLTGAEFFAVPSDFDLQVEAKIKRTVQDNLAEWQAQGLLPDMPIEHGENTSQPVKERGWTYWHHLFNPRQLLLFAYLMKECSAIQDPHIRAAMYLIVAKALNRGSRLCQWQPHRAISGHVFYNQALNTFFNYGCRAFSYFENIFEESFSGRFNRTGDAGIRCQPASLMSTPADIFITDPPYADAVNYHEITEYFIAWFRKNPPDPFRDWIWDSRRPLAIKGDGEEFRHNMVQAYKAMANQMPENGLQIVMFTHQSAAVWADMAQIFWGAGLQVMAAWYIATETTSELKKGGYVQGTVILVLRKRKANDIGYKDEVVQEVKAEVAEQIDTMVGLNQNLKGRGRVENLFEDADLQMAGYAAALRVLTRYESIDGVDMTREALRPRRPGEKNLVGEIIEFAVQVANEHMVPEHMPPEIWGRLSGPERFYFKMMDIETTPLRKLDNYQNFAKAFRVGDYGALMGSMEPNKARLKTAKEFKKSGFEIPEFGPSATRAALFAILELENDVEGDDVLSHLKDMLPNYHNKRDDLAAIADYIAQKRETVDETESRAARILHGLIRNERLG